MAMRGPFIRRGYVKNFGMVSVFSDMDNKNMFFVQKLRGKDATKYVAREKVEFRK